MLLGLTVGAAVGWAAGRVPAPSVLQSSVAVVCAAVVSTALVTYFALRRHGGSEAGGLFFGLGADNLVQLTLLALLGGVLHAALGRLPADMTALVEQRTILLGCAAGLYGGVSTARALRVLRAADPSGLSSDLPNESDAG